MTARVYHAELWGSRKDKYDWLANHDLSSTPWTELAPNSPFYFFAPRHEEQRAEYDALPRINQVFPLNSAGIITARDHFVVDFEEDALLKRMGEFRSSSIPDDEIRTRYFAGKGSAKYADGDTRGWKLPKARQQVRNDKQWKNRIISCLYRPFDRRPVYNVPWMVDWPRTNVMRHMLAGENAAIHVCRQIVANEWAHALVTNAITDDCYVSNKTRERGYTLPLYLYPAVKKPIRESAEAVETWPEGRGGRRPNLDHGFVDELAGKIGLAFVPDAAGDLQDTFGPEDVFHYIYAVLHAPTYRQRYEEFLRIDFPRIPMTSNRELFVALCGFGAKLVAMHLLDSAALQTPITRYPVSGDNLVEKGHPKYLAPGEADPATGKPLGAGRVYLSKDAKRSGRRGQYFEGVEPDVWGFHIGGYRVCEKWLKDRRGRKLSFDELTQYQQIVVALGETIRLMSDIDDAIASEGGWPMR